MVPSCANFDPRRRPRGVVQRPDLDEGETRVSAVGDDRRAARRAVGADGLLAVILADGRIPGERFARNRQTVSQYADDDCVRRPRLTLAVAAVADDDRSRRCASHRVRDLPHMQRPLNSSAGSDTTAASSPHCCGVVARGTNRTDGDASSDRTPGLVGSLASASSSAVSWRRVDVAVASPQGCADGIVRLSRCARSNLNSPLRKCVYPAETLASSPVRAASLRLFSCVLGLVEAEVVTAALARCRNPLNSDIALALPHKPSRVWPPRSLGSGIGAVSDLFRGRPAR